MPLPPPARHTPRDRHVVLVPGGGALQDRHMVLVPSRAALRDRLRLVPIRGSRPDRQLLLVPVRYGHRFTQPRLHGRQFLSGRRSGMRVRCQLGVDQGFRQGAARDEEDFHRQLIVAF